MRFEHFDVGHRDLTERFEGSVCNPSQQFLAILAVQFAVAIRIAQFCIASNVLHIAKSIPDWLPTGSLLAPYWQPRQGRVMGLLDATAVWPEPLAGEMSALALPNCTRRKVHTGPTQGL